MRWFFRRRLSIVFVLGAATCAVPAAACINGMTLVTPRARRPALTALLGPDEQLVPRLARAEEALRLENHWVAATELDLVRREVELATDRVKSRHLRASALVSIRTGGRWPFWVSGSTNNSAEREEVLKEALANLRARAAEDRDDPIRMNDLGEALFAFPERHAEARKVLEKLAARDLVTTARAYLALSRLRAAAGNAKGAAEMLTACKRMDDKGVVCRARAASKV